MVNDIYDKLGENNEVLLYANDAVIWRRGRNIGVDWGFTFSASKSQVVYFTKKKVPETYKMMLYNQQLVRSEKCKYLGIWLDAKLTWKNHIDYIKTKCKM